MTAHLTCFPPHGTMTPILERSEVAGITPAMLDARLVMGWRHFGTDFFRYNFAFHEGLLCGVVALRLRLDDFCATKSQRRILRRNADLTSRIVPSAHSEEYDRLFDIHRVRFSDNVPASLRDFLSDRPDLVPCCNYALEMRLGDALVAVSFFDVSAESTSSVYAMFDPAHGGRSLGNLTLLLEIEQARRLGKRFHYLGYAYTVPSTYDYKKRFRGVEGYDWGRCWTPLPKEYRWSRQVAAIAEE
ncbi:MAG TPA: hypothetical protein VIM61_07615 [Chthoniobacterales bacterium]|jgi:arginine-tRNA-protein transferase